MVSIKRINQEQRDYNIEHYKEGAEFLFWGGEVNKCEDCGSLCKDDEFKNNCCLLCSYRRYRANSNQKKYHQKPGKKERAKEYRNKPENVRRHKLLLNTPQQKLRIKKYHQKPEVNIKRRLRCRFWTAFNQYTNEGKIKPSDEYGINYEAILEHLKPFPEDRHLYHIDHIRPLCSFEFINEDGSQNIEEIQKAFAPENHQWLLAEENLSKSGNWDCDLKEE